MKNKFKKIIIVLFVVFLPIFSFAQSGSYNPSSSCNNNFQTVGDILDWATCMLSNSVIPLLFGVALVIFIYGVVKFIKESESKQKEEGKMFMMWGIIALFVMVSVWGLVNVLNKTFGVRNVIPQLPTTSN